MHIDSSLFLRTRFIPREIGICLMAIDMRMETNEKNNSSSIDCFINRVFHFFSIFFIFT